MSKRFPLITFGLFICALVWVSAGSKPGAIQAAQSTVTIVGSVVDASLTPLAGVSITLERAGRSVATATTGRDGVFRLAGISPGSYRIRAEHKSYPAFTRELNVSAGERTIRLPIVLAGPESKSTATPPPPPPAVPLPAPMPTAPNAAPVAAPEQSARISAGGLGRGGAGTGATIDGIGFAQGQRQMNESVAIDRLIYPPYPPDSYESYAHVPPNRFQSTLERPLSTFGADVDTASYANVRRFLSSGQLPPSDAVRIEELVNYFHFDYPTPRDGKPIAMTTEVGDCPWAPSHKLVLIGARAKTSSSREIEGRNIVLLIDVSGSMSPPERLPMIKTALGMFVDTLRSDDRIAIVTYAGFSGVALPPTPAREREVIQRAIAQLSAGGSTNGASGLITAYRLARQSFIPGGVNRVILATDGDFNVGIVNQSDLLRLIEREKESGVFLSVFGVGSGNLKDSTMEMLADKGNGHYAYLDSLQEARRVLIHEGDATLETVAKDVKFQVEFNPAVVRAWKQIGYENRRLAAQDFNDDRKDGGEMGAGHAVTVIYEVIPVGAESSIEDRTLDRPEIDPLKYQPQPTVARPQPRPDPSHAGEWLTVKARYKTPEGEESALLTQPVRAGARVQYLPFASAVAEFGLLLRDAPRDSARWRALSQRVGQFDLPAALRDDARGFSELVSIAAGLARLR